METDGILLYLGENIDANISITVNLCNVETISQPTSLGVSM